MARSNILRRQRSDEDTLVLDGSAQERVVTDRDTYGAGAWPGGIQPLEGIWWDPRPSRISVLATVGLMFSVAALCATMTGLLAQEGAALGVVGFLLAVSGLVASRRPSVSGRGVAGLGALLALAAVLLAVIAMTRRYPWLDSRTDEISRWHTWLVGHWTWLGRW